LIFNNRNIMTSINPKIMKTLIVGILLLTMACISNAQLQTNRIVFDGLLREYFVFLPQNFEPDMPVVINLHGSGSDDAQWLMNYTLMNNVADTAGFIAVYPQSLPPRWNANCSIPGISEPNVDDVGFISALIDTLKMHYAIDMDRIYCCGLNYGGWMASELICQIGNRFAAGARVNTSLGDSQAARCKLTRPFPMILFNGTADTYLPWPDGKTGVMGGEEAIQWWVERNGCSLDPDTLALPDLDATDNCTVEKISYLSCAGNVEVIFYKVINGGLSWPGAVGNETFDRPRNMDINAGVEIWNFLKRFERSSVYIPDTAFLYALIEEGVDTNGDNLISFEEAEAIISLNFNRGGGQNCLNPDGIKSLDGIEAFINLDTLKCSSNGIRSLDLSNNTALTYLDCSENPITNLDVSYCPLLEELYCEANKLTSLDLSNNPVLKVLNCWAGGDMHTCYQNQLTSLDVSPCPLLEILNCDMNQLTSLNVSNNTALTSLSCGQNQLTSLDVSKNVALNRLEISEMPSLNEVCVWEIPFSSTGVDVRSQGSPNVYFTTGCWTNIPGDNNEKSKIDIYPNPSDDIINIEIENPDNAIIEIYNVSSRLVFSKELNSKIEKIEVSGFPKGIYVVKVMYDKKVDIGKIVIR
jgi:poly(3-hydroxybutyrate) depolymerase